MSVAVFQQIVRTIPSATAAGTRTLNPPAPNENIVRHRLLTSVIFTISFNYLHEIAAMKVLKIIYKDKPAIYKLVLSSDFNQKVRDCWLQHQAQGWVILLGQGLDKHLANAITTAISSGNF